MVKVYGLTCNKQSICRSQIILGGTIVFENDAGLAERMYLGYCSVVDDTVSQQKCPKSNLQCFFLIPSVSSDPFIRIQCWVMLCIASRM